MNVFEAFEAVKNGKKIRKKEWEKGKYLYNEKDKIHISERRTVYIDQVMPISDINMNDEWEIYEVDE